MAVNTKRHGYSCLEIAQILGCTGQTVRTKIENGDLEAFIQQPSRPGGHKRYTISRDHLRNYMIRNKGSFDKDLLQRFGVYDDTKVEEPETPRIDYDHKAEVKTTPTPVGAWKGLIEAATNIVGDTFQEEEKSDTYMVVVNDRICVANIQLTTAVSIVKMLSEDSTFSFKDISIRKK